jgi:hypothetical protein
MPMPLDRKGLGFMRKISVRELVAGSGRDFPIAIASTPANTRQRRIAQSNTMAARCGWQRQILGDLL